MSDNNIQNNSYMPSSYAPGETGEFSCSMWLKTTDSDEFAFFGSLDLSVAEGNIGQQHAGSVGFLAPSSNYSFYVILRDKDGNYDTQFLGGDNSTLPLRDNNWHHVVLTIKGTSIKIYIDGGDAIGCGNDQGVPFATATSNVAYTGGLPNKLDFGRNGNWDNPTNYWFTGKKTQIACWERELTGSEVSTIYNGGVFNEDISSLNPVVWYKFTDVVGQTIPDSGSGNFPAEFINGRYVQDIPEDCVIIPSLEISADPERVTIPTDDDGVHTGTGDDDITFDLDSNYIDIINYYCGSELSVINQWEVYAKTSTSDYAWMPLQKDSFQDITGTTQLKFRLKPFTLSSTILPGDYDVSLTIYANRGDSIDGPDQIQKTINIQATVLPPPHKIEITYENTDSINLHWIVAEGEQIEVNWDVDAGTETESFSRVQVHGDNVTKNFDEVKTRTVRITGAITGFGHWHSVSSNNNIIAAEIVGMPNMTHCSYAFSGANKLTRENLKISEWNTSNITSFAYLFENCSSLTTLDLSTLDVSSATNFGYMFSGCSELTQLNMSGWDTSTATTMLAMFKACKKLETLDVSHFVTDNVTNFSGMFQHCNALQTLNVSNFNTENATALLRMFMDCISLTELDISNFKTPICENFTSMFAGNENLQTLTFNTTDFTTSEANDLSSMFYNCSSLSSLDVSNFNVEKVLNISSMFAGCSLLSSLNLSSFNPKIATNLSGMFSRCTALTSLDLSTFETSEATNMSVMFYLDSSLQTLTLSPTKFDTQQVTNFTNMFSGCSDIQDFSFVNHFDVSSATTFRSMFSVCSAMNNIDLSSWTTSENLENMNAMFNGCSSLTSLTLNFDTSGVSDFKSLFNDCTALTTLNIDFDTSSALRMANMFSGCENLETLTTVDNFKFDAMHERGWPGDIWVRYDHFSNMFNGCTKLTNDTINFIDWCTDFMPHDTGLQGAQDFATNSGLTYLPDWGYCGGNKIEITYENTDSINLSWNIVEGEQIEVNWDVDAGTETESFSRGNVHGDNVTKDFDEVKTRTVQIRGALVGFGHWHSAGSNSNIIEAEIVGMSTMTYCGYAFHNANKLTSENLKISRWDTSNITSFAYLFSSCSSLTALDLSTLDVSSATSFGYMFSGCTELTQLNMSGWDTSTANLMVGMFRSCKKLETLDVSHFVTDNVTSSFGYMFQGCESLQTLNVSNFNTSGASNLEYMFRNCKALQTLNVSNFNTENAIHMEGMFMDCISLTELDISNFKTPICENFSAMFAGNENLQTLTFNTTDFTTSEATNLKSMFYNCSSLSSLDVSNFNVEKVLNISSMFYNCSLLSSLNLSSFNPKIATTFESMFEGCSNLTSLDLSTFETSEAKIMTRMFSGCSSLQTLTLSPTKFDTQQVTNFGVMFAGCSDIQDFSFVNHFDVSSATTMYYMFSECSAMNNIDLSSWTTSPELVNTSYMFNECSSLTSLTLNFDTSGVSNFQVMFKNCTALTTLNIDFDTSSATRMSYMFSGCENLETLTTVDNFKFDAMVWGDDWAVNRSYFSNMFNGCTKLTNDTVNFIDWCTDFIPTSTNLLDSSFTSFAHNSGLTYLPDWGYCSGNKIEFTYQDTDLVQIGLYFSGPIEINWDVDEPDQIETFDSAGPHVSVYSKQYDSVKTRTITIRGPVTRFGSSTSQSQSKMIAAKIVGMPSLQHLNSVFEHCSNLTVENLDLSQFDSSNIVNMYGMFRHCTGFTTKLDLTTLDVSNVTQFGGTFHGCKNIPEIDTTGWDTSSATSMSSMFQDCQQLDVDVDHFVTDGVGDFAAMFRYCYNMSDIPLSSWNTSSATTMSYMFANCTGLTSLNLNNVSSNATNMSYMFAFCSGLTSADLTGFTTPLVQNLTGTFHGCSNVPTFVGIETWETPALKNTSLTFDGCTNLQSLDLSKFDTSDVTNMTQMFRNCENLQSLIVSSFDTTSVEFMQYMFHNCKKLSLVDLSTFDTSLVKMMNYMFAGFASDLSEPPTITFSDTFKTDEVVNCHYMFSGCSTIQDFSFVNNFNVSKVEDFQYMFNECSAMNNIDLSSWTTSPELVNTSYMFSDCSSLTSLTLNFDTSGVVDFTDMFAQCTALTTLNIDFDTSSALALRGMFHECENLETLTTVDNFTFDAMRERGWWPELGTHQRNNSFGNLFYGCTKLTNDSVNFIDWCVDFMPEYADEDHSSGLSNFATNSGLTQSPNWGFCGGPLPMVCDPHSVEINEPEELIETHMGRISLSPNLPYTMSIRFKLNELPEEGKVAVLFHMIRTGDSKNKAVADTETNVAGIHVSVASDKIQISNTKYTSWDIPFTATTNTWHHLVWGIATSDTEHPDYDSNVAGKWFACINGVFMGHYTGGSIYHLDYSGDKYSCWGKSAYSDSWYSTPPSQFKGAISEFATWNEQLTHRNVNVGESPKGKLRLMCEYQDGLTPDLTYLQPRNWWRMGDAENEYSLDTTTTNGYLDTGELFQSTIQNGFTVMCWAKRVPDSVAGSETEVLISTEGTDTRNRMKVYYQNGNLNAWITKNNERTTTLVDDTTDTTDWFHIALSYKQKDPNSVEGNLYVNGELKGTSVDMHQLMNEYLVADPSSNLCFGTQKTNKSLAWGGYIDEAAIFDSVLSDSDINSIYNNGRPDDLSSYDPVGWWRMGDVDEINGNVVSDRGSGNNDGTLVDGASFSTDVSGTFYDDQSKYEPVTIEIVDNFYAGTQTTDNSNYYNYYINGELLPPKTSNDPRYYIRDGVEYTFVLKEDSIQSGGLKIMYTVLDGTWTDSPTLLNAGDSFTIKATANRVNSTFTNGGDLQYAQMFQVIGITSSWVVDKFMRRMDYISNQTEPFSNAHGNIGLTNTRVGFEGLNTPSCDEISLLVQSDTATTDDPVLDSSKYAHSVSRTLDDHPVSGVIHDPSTPYLGNNSSFSFNGTSDYLSVAHHPDLDLGSDDFTIEAHIKFTGTPATGNGSYVILSTGLVSDNDVEKGLTFRIIDTGLQTLYSTDGTTKQFFTSDVPLTENTWYHVALVRSNDTFAYYVNGVLSGTKTINGAIHASTEPVLIGVSRGTNGSGSKIFYQFYEGHVQDVRISKKAVYTGNNAECAFPIPQNLYTKCEFDPSTCPEGVSSPSCAEISLLVQSDVRDSDPEPLLWLDASDINSLVFNESNKVIELKDKSNNANHATNENSSFTESTINGTRAINFNSGSTATCLDFNNINLANNEASIFYVFEIPDGVGGGFGVLGARSPGIQHSSDNDNYDYHWNGSIYSHHFRETRLENLSGPTTTDVRLVSIIANENTGLYEYRINGEVVYTSSESFVFDNNINRLGCALMSSLKSGNFGESIFINETANIHTEKIEGYLAHKWGIQLPAEHTYHGISSGWSEQLSDSSKYAHDVRRTLDDHPDSGVIHEFFTSYAGNNSSFAFNGTSDYLNVGHPDLDLGSEDFTIEAHINFTGTPGDNEDSYAIISKWLGINPPHDKQFIFWVRNSKLQLLWTSDGTSNQTFTGSQTLVENTWYHVAVVRSNDTLSFYIDGVLDATQTINGAIHASTSATSECEGKMICVTGATDSDANGEYCVTENPSVRGYIAQSISGDTPVEYTHKTNPYRIYYQDAVTGSTTFRAWWALQNKDTGAVSNLTPSSQHYLPGDLSGTFGNMIIVNCRDTSSPVLIGTVEGNSDAHGTKYLFSMYQGHIQDVRISKKAVYTSNTVNCPFSVPTILHEKCEPLIYPSAESSPPTITMSGFPSISVTGLISSDFNATYTRSNTYQSDYENGQIVYTGIVGSLPGFSFNGGPAMDFPAYGFLIYHLTEDQWNPSIIAGTWTIKVQNSLVFGTNSDDIETTTWYTDYPNFTDANKLTGVTATLG